MEEVMVNELTEEGRRRMQIAGDAPLTLRAVYCAITPKNEEGIEMREWKDEVLGLQYGEAEWAPKGEVVDFQPVGWPRARRFVVWGLEPGEKVSEVIILAAKEFLRLFGGKPQFAFMRKLPKGVENATGIMFMGMEILLFEAEWMPKRCVAVGGKAPPPAPPQIGEHDLERGEEKL